MEDYKEIMQDILLQYYSATPDGGNTVQMSTKGLLYWFQGVIPQEPIDEHDVFDVVKDLGFIHSQKILTTQDEDSGEETETGRVLVWNLYEKTV